MKTYTFHVSGMHCASCTVLIESTLTEVSHVARARASLTRQSVEVHGDFGDMPLERIAEALSHLVHPHGYALSVQQRAHTVNWRDFVYAVPIAGAFIAFFILLQKVGLVNLVTTSDVSYGTAFIIGLIASVSSCMAVVGGLVLSLSSSFAQKGERVRPQVLFHVGRFVSFFVLGGVIGLVGSTFQLGSMGTFVLSLVVGLILLTLGINLLDVVPWTRRFQLTLPRKMGSSVQRLVTFNHSCMPVAVGAATFFLPCGFTQSMQMYALTTGSFWTGALTMSVFALGTFPVLALLSFGLAGIHSRAQTGVFFKTAGLIVIFFGIFNIMSSLVAIGVIPPLLSI